MSSFTIKYKATTTFRRGFTTGSLFMFVLPIDDVYPIYCAGCIYILSTGTARRYTINLTMFSRIYLRFKPFILLCSVGYILKFKENKKY
jgi:hypothetical protein